MREVGVALVILGLMIAVAGGLALVKTKTVTEPSTTTTATTNSVEPKLCDTFRKTIAINDPDPPGMDYYNGYLVIVFIPPCDVSDVTVIWDYVPSRPMSSGNAYFEVYFDGQLIYNGTSTVIDFPDSQWDGKTVLVEVKAYSSS